MGKIIDAIFIFLGCIWYIIIWGLGLKFLFYFHKYISDNSFLNFIFYIVVIFCIYKILKQIKEIYYIKNIFEKTETIIDNNENSENKNTVPKDDYNEWYENLKREREEKNKKKELEKEREKIKNYNNFSDNNF